MKSDSVSAYIHMRRETLVPLYAAVRILDDPPHLPSVEYVLNWWPLSQPKNI